VIINCSRAIDSSIKSTGIVAARKIGVSPFMSSSCISLILPVLLYFPYIAAASRTVTQLTMQRHNIPPLNKDADTEYPESQEFQDMLSPCKPERGGYFGGTSGDPAVLQYGFELESALNIDISNALYMIKEHLIDSIVSVTFPSVCSSRDLSLTNAATTDIVGVTGFNFGEDFSAVRKCQCLMFN
jgi:hypothetical protein